MELDNDNLLRDFFASRPIDPQPLPASVEDRIMSRVMSRAQSESSTRLERATVWAFAVVGVLSMAGVGWLLWHYRVFDFENFKFDELHWSSIDWSLFSFDFPSFNFAPHLTTMWLMIFALATGLGICSHFLMRSWSKKRA